MAQRLWTFRSNDLSFLRRLQIYGTTAVNSSAIHMQRCGVPYHYCSRTAGQWCKPATETSGRFVVSALSVSRSASASCARLYRVLDMDLPSMSLSELVERLSILSQWTTTVVVIVVVVIIIATMLCYMRRRRPLYGGGGTRYHPPVYVSSSLTKTCPETGSTDPWLQRVVEWVWSRRHVTWRHVASCAVDAWMTALTEQASRQSVKSGSDFCVLPFWSEIHCRPTTLCPEKEATVFFAA